MKFEARRVGIQEIRSTGTVVLQIWRNGLLEDVSSNWEIVKMGNGGVNEAEERSKIKRATRATAVVIFAMKRAGFVFGRSRLSAGTDQHLP
jgi:hypothetical protein